jgi:hypothetical protein
MGTVPAMTDSFRMLICAMGMGRILLGLAPFVAAAPCPGSSASPASTTRPPRA